MFFFLLGDVREKLRLAFDMYDMNKNGKVNTIIIYLQIVFKIFHY